MHVALDLIAMAVGYKVFVEASKEKKGAREVGRIIGVFIVSAAFAAAAYSGMVTLSKCSMSGGGSCPFMSKMCHMGR